MNILKFYKRFISNFIKLFLNKHPPLTLAEVYQNVLAQTKINPTFLLEIGSRDGLDADLLAKAFDISHSNVLIVEANPYCAKNIRQDFPSFKVFEKAIFNTNQPMYFNKIEGINSGVSSLKNRKDNYYENKSVQIVVETETGETFMTQNLINQIDICKIDVEGCTLEVLQSFGDRLTCIKSMHIECEHREVWQKQFLYEDVNAFLTSKGYQCLYFNFVADDTLQSDSIWVFNDYIIKGKNEN